MSTADAAAELTKQKLLHKKAHSYPATTPKSDRQRAAVRGANPTLFNNKARDDSPDSNIAGGSSEWDPFRAAMAEFARNNPGINGPPGTLFGNMESKYHAANKSAKEVKKEMAALPQAEKDKMKSEYAALLKQENDGRKAMKSNWPGYDEWKSSQGHNKRIQIVDQEIVKLEKQIAKLQSKVKTSKKQ